MVGHLAHIHSASNLGGFTHALITLKAPSLCSALFSPPYTPLVKMACLFPKQEHHQQQQKHFKLGPHLVLHPS